MAANQDHAKATGVSGQGRGEGERGGGWGGVSYYNAKVQSSYIACHKYLLLGATDRIEKQIYFVAIKVFFMPSAIQTDMYMQERRRGGTEEGAGMGWRWGASEWRQGHLG